MPQSPFQNQIKKVAGDVVVRAGFFHALENRLTSLYPSPSVLSGDGYILCNFKVKL